MNDFKRYQALALKLKYLLDLGQYESQEFKIAWDEMERIKNRHGGIPPKETDEI